MGELTSKNMGDWLWRSPVESMDSPVKYAGGVYCVKQKNVPTHPCWGLDFEFAIINDVCDQE